MLASWYEDRDIAQIDASVIVGSNSSKCDNKNISRNRFVDTYSLDGGGGGSCLSSPITIIFIVIPSDANNVPILSRLTSPA